MKRQTKYNKLAGVVGSKAASKTSRTKGHAKKAQPRILKHAATSVMDARLNFRKRDVPFKHFVGKTKKMAVNK